MHASSQGPPKLGAGKRYSDGAPWTWATLKEELRESRRSHPNGLQQTNGLQHTTGMKCARDKGGTGMHLAPLGAGPLGSATARVNGRS